jgi:hypothetical protein
LAFSKSLCPGELTVQSAGSIGIGFARCLFICKKPEVDIASICDDMGHPLLCLLVPHNPLQSAGIVFLRAAVSVVLAVGGKPEVTAPIIQSVAVSVIYLNPRSRVHYDSVHQYAFFRFPEPHVPSGVPRVAVKKSRPGELRYERIVGSIDQRHFVLAQRDELYGRVNAANFWHCDIGPWLPKVLPPFRF